MSDLESDYSKEETKSNSSLVIKGPTSVATRVVQLGVVLLFFAGMVGAFCYAVLDGEKGNNDQDTEEIGLQNGTEKWSVFRTEYSDSGYCILTFPLNETRKTLKDAEEGGEGGGEDGNTLQFESYWYQDNDLKRIFTRVDEDYAAFVFADYTFWAKIDPKTENTLSCYKDATLGYNEFIHRLGLYNMIDRHSEIRTIRNDKKVFVFDGEPSNLPMRTDSQLSYFVRAYADYNTAVLFGWDTFYSKKTAKLLHCQCWFDEMAHRKPSEAVWATLPAECH